MTTFARVALEPRREGAIESLAPTFGIMPYIATLRRKPSTLPRRLAAACSTA